MSKMIPAQQILVVYLPGLTPDKLEKARDYVETSVRRGVLALTGDARLEIKNMPGRAEPEVEVTACAAELPLAAEKNKADPELPRQHDINFMGAAGGEKKQIHERMRRYRDEAGLGCWDALVKTTGKAHITVDVIRQMYLGEISANIDDWRAINRGLTRLGVALAPEKGASDG